MHKGAVQAQHWCTAAASARRCSVVAPAASPAHKAQLTTALMAQGWCHESVDIATAQGAVQQLRATVPHRSSVAAAAVSPLQRRRCTKRMWVLPATGQRGGYPFEWVSNYQVLTAVHLNPLKTKNRTFTLLAGDKKTATEAMEKRREGRQ